MANEKEQKPQQQTAAERLSNLEQVVTALFQSSNQIARDLGIAKDAIKLLGNKLDSVVQALAAGSPVNDTTISALMVQNNVKELTEKVTSLVSQGVLVPTDTVSENSFVVGQEIAIESDTVLNPRIQFSLNTLQDEKVRAAINGHKVGDLFAIEEGKMRFKVVEAYNVAAPKDPDAPVEPVAPAEPATPAAPVIAVVPDAPAETPAAPAQA